MFNLASKKNLDKVRDARMSLAMTKLLIDTTKHAKESPVSGIPNVRRISVHNLIQNLRSCWYFSSPHILVMTLIQPPAM